MAVELKYLVELFDGATACFAFMREPDVVERDCRHGKDVDVWCPYERVHAVSRALVERGFWLVSGRAAGKRGSPRHSTTLRFARFEHGRPLKPSIEVFFGALRWHSVIYLPSDVVETSVRRGDGAPYLTGAALLAVLVTRTALRGTLAGERLERARRAYAEAGESARRLWFEHAAALLGDGEARRLARFVETGEGRPRGGAYYRAVCHLRHPEEVPELLVKARARAAPRRGFCCYLMGTDGSGKSTLSERVADRLSAGLVTTRALYFGRTRGNAPVIERVRRVAFGALRRAGIEPQPKRVLLDGSLRTDPSRVPGHTGLYRGAVALGALVYVAEYWWRHLARVLPELYRGDAVILDRSPFDLRLMKGLPEPLQGLVEVVPRPDMIVFCDADPEVIFARKPERTLDDIASQQRAYRSLFEAFRKRVPSLRVDTSEPAEQNVARIFALAAAVFAVHQGKLDRELLHVLTEAP